MATEIGIGWLGSPRVAELSSVLFAVAHLSRVTIDGVVCRSQLRRRPILAVLQRSYVRRSGSRLSNPTATWETGGRDPGLLCLALDAASVTTRHGAIFLCMCQRFYLAARAAEIKKVFKMEDLPELVPRYNIAPTQHSPIVT